MLSIIIKPLQVFVVLYLSSHNLQPSRKEHLMPAQNILIAATGLLTACLMATPVFAKKDLPAYNEDGMKLIKDTRMSTIYADPDADLSAYKKIMLEDASVAFKKNWQRDKNRDSAYSSAFTIKDSDVQRIKEDVATLFKEVFTKELIAGGYQLVETPGEDVLIVKPAIVDLDVVAPDVRSSFAGRSYSESAGEMTLDLELFDSQTNDLIVKAKDRKRDFQTGYMEWRTSVSNRAAAMRMMKSWAKALRESLDDARLTVHS